MATRKEKAEEKRKKLIEAALDLFQSEGYFQTDIRKIAAKANIGLGTFYNYFKTKKELYLTIFQQEYLSVGMNTYSEDMLEILNQLSLKQLTAFIIRKHYESHTHSQLFYRETAALIALDDDVRHLNDQLEQQMISHFLTIINSKKSEIKELNPERSLRIIFNALEENIHSLLEVNDQNEIDETLAELTEMVYLYLVKK